MGMEIIFEVRDAEEGGYCARALGHGIFTEAETWEELRANVLEAISVHFEDGSYWAEVNDLPYLATLLARALEEAREQQKE